MKKEFIPPNCQVHPIDCLKAVSSIQLDTESYRSRFINVNNIADDGMIAMEKMLSCYYHFQAN
jgi:hypothetical protein